MSKELVWETIKKGGLVLTLEYDGDAESPRTSMDNMGTMICFSSRNRLGDKHEFKTVKDFFRDLIGYDEFEKIKDRYENDEWSRIDKKYPGNNPNRKEAMAQNDRDHQAAIQEAIAKKCPVFLPLYVYEHGGITMNTTGYSCPWDSGQAGWIYATAETIRKEYGKVLTKARIEKARKYLVGEVETYAQFLEGDVHGYTLRAAGENDEDGPDDKVLDSCWGFYGREDVEREGRDALEHYIQKRAEEKQHQEDLDKIAPCCD